MENKKPKINKKVTKAAFGVFSTLSGWGLIKKAASKSLNDYGGTVQRINQLKEAVRKPHDNKTESFDQAVINMQLSENDIQYSYAVWHRRFRVYTLSIVILILLVVYTIAIKLAMAIFTIIAVQLFLFVKIMEASLRCWQLKNNRLDGFGKWLRDYNAWIPKKYGQR